MIKIIFIDIDGTLKDRFARIPQSIYEVIALCKQKGIHLCLCTGRSVSMIQEDVKQLSIANMIAGGGNYIVVNGNKIFQDSFAQEEIEYILSCGIIDKEALFFESNEEVFMNKKAKEILVTMNKKMMEDMTWEQKQYYHANEKIVYEDNMHTFCKSFHRIHKIGIWCEEKTFACICEKIRNYQLVQKSCWGNLSYYEFVKCGCDKGSAVQKVMAHLRLTKDMSMCFGNGQNDIAMFQQCSIAVAMEDGDEQLKQYASAVCEAAHEDGIFKELRRRKII